MLCILEPVASKANIQTSSIGQLVVLALVILVSNGVELELGSHGFYRPQVWIHPFRSIVITFTLVFLNLLYVIPFLFCRLFLSFIRFETNQKVPLKTKTLFVNHLNQRHLANANEDISISVRS